VILKVFFKVVGALRLKLINSLSLGILKNGSEAKKFRATPQ
jgi:hypothetical protein